MFDRFTERARRVMVLAQDEARLLNHNFIGTEHLLLGLVREGEGMAAVSLREFGVTLNNARRAVREAVGAFEADTDEHAPFTPRAKKVLELSGKESRQLGHNYIGTEHLLLGLVREGEGLGVRVLSQLGADPSAVRAQLLRFLSRPPSDQSPPEPPGTPACPTCGRPVVSAAHHVIRSTAMGYGEDEANEISVTVGCCPSCGAVLGTLPGPR